MELEKIDDKAFYDCSTLTLIELPNSITSIGSKVFPIKLDTMVWNMKKYKNGVSDKQTPFYQYDNYGSYFSNITTLIFGDEVEYIPSYLCRSISSLRTVKFGKNIFAFGTGSCIMNYYKYTGGTANEP